MAHPSFLSGLNLETASSEQGQGRLASPRAPVSVRPWAGRAGFPSQLSCQPIGCLGEDGDASDTSGCLLGPLMDM